MFKFNDPLYLLFLLIIPLSIYLRYYRKKNIFQAGMNFSSIKLFQRGNIFTSFWKKNLVFILTLLSLTSFIIALARPQYQTGYIDIQSEGIDIVLLLDVSNSMRNIDGIQEGLVAVNSNYSTSYIDREGKINNRLDIAKKILIEFIEKRKNDRIGLVIFSDYPYTESPITISRDIIIEKIRKIDYTKSKGGNTAIGDAIVSGINKLTHSDSKSKIIILTTDGNSNKGENPISMSQLAADENIKIYTIGIGGNEEVLKPKDGINYNIGDWIEYVPMDNSYSEKLDEETLKKIALITDGKYFRGSNEEELREIYNEIDKLEKSKSEFENIYRDYEEYFFPFLLIGLIFLILAFILDNTLLRVLP